MQMALGLIEALGLTTAVAALDAASKAADITLIGTEKIIGVGGMVGVNIQIAGEVAAVKAAVDAGVEAANRVGIVQSSHVIPRPHDEVDKLIEKFQKNLKDNKDKVENKAKKENNDKKESKKK
ncbi:MAG: BMC domain-containing protein [Tissierellia bacterium]|nr:BMC domain-containing protein [Tissierellia bacterium]